MSLIKNSESAQMPRHFALPSKDPKKLSFPLVGKWLSSEGLSKTIIKMQKMGRFRNERTVQALIWTYLETQFMDGNFYPDYQFDVEIYSEEEGYPDLSLCSNMENDTYKEVKHNRTFNDYVWVWIELKYYPNTTNAETVREELEADLQKCNYHARKEDSTFQREAYMFVVCKGEGTFGQLIGELKGCADPNTIIIPIYLE